MENTIGIALGNLLGTTAKKLGLVDVYVGMREGAEVPMSPAEAARNNPIGRMLETAIAAMAPSLTPGLLEALQQFMGSRGQDDDGDRTGDPRYGTIAVEYGPELIAGPGSAIAVSATYEGTPFRVTGAASVHDALRKLAGQIEEDFIRVQAAADAASSSIPADPTTGKN
jgi:hypothetical protein